MEDLPIGSEITLKLLNRKLVKVASLIITDVTQAICLNVVMQTVLTERV